MMHFCSNRLNCGVSRKHHALVVRSELWVSSCSPRIPAGSRLELLRVSTTWYFCWYVENLVQQEIISLESAPQTPCASLVVLCDTGFAEPLCPTHEQIQCGTRSALPMAGLFAHRWPGVGRMLGAPNLHRVAALTWLDKPFGPTHPDVGCMTARRCAKVLAGGFQVSWLACCEGRPKECTRPVLSCECLGLGPWFFWLQSFSEVLPCAWATWQHNGHDIL